MDKGFAPAKVNLALHVTGQRADGYHLLDSLVVFAGVGDQISATSARNFTVQVTGAFSTGVPTDDSNLVIRAAKLLARRRNIPIGAVIKLTKSLPSAAGIGGGSSDGAATLRYLAQLWKVPPLPADDPEVVALGADFPVCMNAPAPQRMQGIGEKLTPWGPLPSCALILVNPRIEVATRDVFAAMTSRNNSPMEEPPATRDFDSFTAWLSRQRNDMEPAARSLAPEIDKALTRLSAAQGVQLARMSGSGATCFGLCRDFATARRAAMALQIAEQGWWVAPAGVLS